MRRKIFRYIAIIAAALIFAAVIAACSLAARDRFLRLQIELNNSGYYSEDEYYGSEAEYNQYLRDNGIAADGGAGTFITAASQKVWVDEKFRWDFQQPRSRLLNAEQMEKYADSSVTLTIDVALWRDDASQTYYVKANALWGSGNADKPQLSAWLDLTDFFGITWGGAGKISALQHGAAGTYRDGAPLETSTSNSDSYGWYIWQFKNRKTNSYMKNISAEVRLNNELETQGRPADIKLAYVHRYNTVSDSMFYVDGGGNSHEKPEELREGYAPYVQVEGDFYWRLDIAVSGLTY